MPIRFVLVVLLGSLLSGCQDSSRVASSVTVGLSPSSVDAKKSSHPIRITSGGLTVDSLHGTVELKGTAGFQLSSTVAPLGGFFSPAGCVGPLDCPPGGIVDLRASWVGNDLVGTATLRGKTYDDLGGLSPTSPSASVDFIGSLRLPPFTPDGTVEVSAPFRFTGHFSSIEDGTESREELVGHGTVTLAFQRDPWEGTAWLFRNAVYEFEASNR